MKKYNKSIYEKCLGPFLTIFGNRKAIKSLYFLTGFLTLYPSGKREREGNIFLRSNFNTREFNGRELFQLFQLYSKRLSSFLTIFGHKIAQLFL